jgi:hypothetical protein
LPVRMPLLLLAAAQVTAAGLIEVRIDGGPSGGDITKYSLACFGRQWGNSSNKIPVATKQEGSSSLVGRALGTPSEAPSSSTGTDGFGRYYRLAQTFPVAAATGRSGARGASADRSHGGEDSGEDSTERE